MKKIIILFILLSGIFACDRNDYDVFNKFTILPSGTYPYYFNAPGKINIYTSNSTSTIPIDGSITLEISINENIDPLILGLGPINVKNFIQDDHLYFNYIIEKKNESTSRYEPIIIDKTNITQPDGKLHMNNLFYTGVLKSEYNHNNYLYYNYYSRFKMTESGKYRVRMINFSQQHNNFLEIRNISKTYPIQNSLQIYVLTAANDKLFISGNYYFEVI